MFVFFVVNILILGLKEGVVKNCNYNVYVDVIMGLGY